jgi:hypothetical protein
VVQFKAFDPDVEVNGAAVLSVIDGMGGFQNKAREILANHGIENPKAGCWYNQQAWLDAFSTIAETLGSKALYNIGRKIPENAVWPPVVEDIRSALSSINVAYRMNHRGGQIGSYDYLEIDDNSARIICNNPYPDEFDRGIISAVADKFKPEGTFMVEVKQDDSLPNRTEGGEFTSFIICW